MKNLTSSDISTTEFFVRNLEYIETPQYLRKALFPKSEALRYSGLVNPLEADHHLKISEWCKYREGVIIRRPVRESRGSWANIGLLKDCQVNMMLEENTRVTVKLNENAFNHENKCKTIALTPFLVYSGNVVSAAEPSERMGLYWGYRVRVAGKFEDIFEECPYKEGYDLKLGISNDKGALPSECVDFEEYRGFKHALVFFGGIEGIEGIVE
jgi:predicted SPOUT superfamily RNA methylase MTH1